MSSPKSSPYVDMPVPELVKALCDHAQPGSKMHEEIKGALSAALTKKLTDSIDRHEQAATCLAKRLLWLNIILGVFTVAGTGLAIISFIR